MTQPERVSSQGDGNLKKLWIAVGAVLMLTAAPPAVRAQIGLIVDAGVLGDSEFTGSAHVFDATTDEVLGSVSFPAGIADFGIENNADCSMTSDGMTAYVATSRLTSFPATFETDLQVLDLSDPSAPVATSRIVVPLFAADTAISPDGKYLLVCDRGVIPSPLTVVTIPGGVVSTFDLGATACTAVDICTDAATSVLVNDFAAGAVRRLTLASDGVLTDTGESLAMGSAFTAGPINLDCSPSGTTGVAAVGTTGEVRSFSVPGLVVGQTQAVAGVTLGALISTDESRVFTRSVDSLTPPTAGILDFFFYDSSGTIDPLIPVIGFGVRREFVIVGIESMAVHPDGSKLYVSEPFLDTLATPGEVNIYDTATGALIGALTDTGGVVATPTGICFPTPLVGGGPLAFDDFTGFVQIALLPEADDDEVLLNTNFKLDALDSDGIDPENEDLTITVTDLVFGTPSVSVTIPAGNFVKKTTPKKEFFTVEGVFDGITVELKIDVLLAGSEYTFKGSLAGANLDGIGNEVTVDLTVGDDGSSFNAFVSFI